MARNFSGSDHLAGASDVSLHPDTNDIVIFIWETTTATAFNVMVSKSGTNTTDREWSHYGTGTANKSRPLINNTAGGTHASADSTSDTNDGSWHCLGLVWDAGTRLENWFDGSEESSDTTFSGTANNHTRPVYIGMREQGATLHWVGNLAECVIWNNLMNDTHYASLAHGVNPFAYKSSSMIVFTELWGNESTELDIAQQNNFTNNGSSKSSTHPPVELLENFL